jgi:hypothetical protein
MKSHGAERTVAGTTKEGPLPVEGRTPSRDSICKMFSLGKRVDHEVRLLSLDFLRLHQFNPGRTRCQARSMMVADNRRPGPDQAAFFNTMTR